MAQNNKKHNTSRDEKRYMTKEETIAFVTDLFNREADKIDEMYKKQQRNGNNKEW